MSDKERLEGTVHIMENACALWQEGHVENALRMLHARIKEYDEELGVYSAVDGEDMIMSELYAFAKGVPLLQAKRRLHDSKDCK